MKRIVLAALVAALVASAAKAQWKAEDVALSAILSGNPVVRDSTGTTVEVAPYPELILGDFSCSLATATTGIVTRIPRGYPGGLVRIPIETNVPGAKFKDGARDKKTGLVITRVPDQELRAKMNGVEYPVRYDKRGQGYVEFSTDGPDCPRRGLLTVVTLLDAKSGKVVREVPVLGKIANIFTHPLGIRNPFRSERDGQVSASNLTVLTVADYFTKDTLRDLFPKDTLLDLYFYWNGSMDEFEQKFKVVAFRTPQIVIDAVKTIFSSNPHVGSKVSENLTDKAEKPADLAEKPVSLDTENYNNLPMIDGETGTNDAVVTPKSAPKPAPKRHDEVKPTHKVRSCFILDEGGVEIPRRRTSEGKWVIRSTSQEDLSITLYFKEGMQITSDKATEVDNVMLHDFTLKTHNVITVKPRDLDAIRVSGTRYDVVLVDGEYDLHLQRRG